MYVYSEIFDILQNAALNEILQHPKSKLVPAGVEVTFHCKLADDLDSYWVVDRFPGSTQQHRTVLGNRGFFIRKTLQDGVATLSLTVTATVGKNGTVVFCSSIESFMTDTAVLLVIQRKF